LYEDDLVEIENLLNKICEEYYNILGVYPIIFEHGSLPEGRHPLSITHAHLHIIPINLSNNNINSLFSDLKLELKENIIEYTNKILNLNNVSAIRKDCEK